MPADLNSKPMDVPVAPPSVGPEERIAALEAETAALRAALEDARRILRSATDYAVITLNLGGRITGWDAGAERILGYSAEASLGRFGDILFVPEDRAGNAFVAELCQTLERGRAVNERWHVRQDGSRFWASGLMLPLLDADGATCGFLNILRDASEAHAAEEHREFLIQEMRHRSRNIFATVQTVAAKTARCTTTVREFQAAFSTRLLALAGSHDLLDAGHRDGAALDEVVGRSLSPYEGEPDRIVRSGPPVRLHAGNVMMLGLALHELATNAAKHGALSVPEGSVEVSWRLSRGGGARPASVEIAWRERGGPTVKPPQRQGFGTQLLGRGLTQDRGVTAQLDFAPMGVECRIWLPLQIPSDMPDATQHDETSRAP